MAESLGSLLRQKRESLGLSLEEVERHTHIRVKHLKAIETDDLSAIPSVPQARGFIHNYATFLGITPAETTSPAGGTTLKPAIPPVALSAPATKEVETPTPRTAPNPATEPVSPFRENPSTGVATIPRSETYARPRTLAGRSIAREWFRVDRIFGGVIALIIVALLGWGGYSMVVSFAATPGSTTTGPFLAAGSETATETSATNPSTPAGTVENATGGLTPAGTLELTPGQTPSESTVLLLGTISVATVAPTSFPTPLGGVYTDVRIHITVLQRAYLMVTVDGKVAFSDRVLPGSSYDFVGQKTIALATGNGAGISVLFNGVDQGAIGRFGEVVSLTYTSKGALTPTPVASLTPTITPSPTSTSTSTKKP
jgi:transcriptional regulator with XRE-family HTH domain